MAFGLDSNDSLRVCAPLKDIEVRLKSRKSLEAALQDLERFLSGKSREELLQQHGSALLHLTNRIMILLKSRYSSPVFWQAAEATFQTCQLALGKGSKLSRQIEASLVDCQRFLRNSSEPIHDQTASLFEGQLTHEQEKSQTPSRTYEDFISELFAERLGSDGQTQPPAERRQDFEDQQIAMLAELGMIDESARTKPPPASRRAIKRLRQIVLTEAVAASLREADTQTLCSICREEFHIGDTLQIMPCSSHHCFHPPCLGPWLQDNNSCPICRFELETDDIKYETEKVQRQQDELARRGAANAQSHNDFLYI